jgi:hypothetical protein
LNIEINSEKLNLIPACTRKRSLSCRCQINPPVHHSSHPKCFQIMNIQIVEFDCYLRGWTVPILLFFIKNRMSISKILLPYFFSIFVQNNKTSKRDRIWKYILKSWIWFLLENGPLFWFRANQSLIFLLNGVCLSEKLQIPIA